jgi:uncharacterized protein YgbK (DUF1537 family)
MKRCLIIADDFTGANDTGVQLVIRGIETNVILDGKDITDVNISYVLDTETRNMNSELAYRCVKDKLIGICFNDFDLIYKKVDSTLRGNISSELKAIDEEYKPDLIVFAPAYPDNGRITKNAIHYVNNTRVIESEFSKDPKKPVMEDNIQKILQFNFSEPVIHHNLTEIRENKINLKNARIHTFDAENNGDLEKMVLSAISTDKKVLWVGSAGLANVILNIVRPKKPVLAIVGSLSEVSRKQVKYAENKGISVLKIDVSSILQGENNIEDYTNLAKDILNQGKDLIITSAYDLIDYEKSINVGKTLSKTKEEVSSITQDILGGIGKKIIETSNISGLFITGGDVAIGFIKNTNTVGSKIIEEISTGIPLMKLIGGEFNGLKVVTKAGGFGKEEAIYHSIEKLKEEK